MSEWPGGPEKAGLVTCQGPDEFKVDDRVVRRVLAHVV